MVDWTPFPGTPVPVEQAQRIVDEWKTQYRINTEGRHPQIPTWCTFPSNILSRRADESVWDELVQRNDLVVYFYNEYGPEPKLYSATPHQVRSYFQRRNPWEDQDYYIFDLKRTWCVAVTHDNIIIVVGDLK